MLKFALVRRCPGDKAAKVVVGEREHSSAARQPPLQRSAIP